MIDFKLPDIGEGIKNVIVTDILISNGSKVKKNDIIIIVESEKASMEIPIDKNCLIKDILVKSGDTISPGDTIVQISLNDVVKNEEIVEKMKIIDDVSANQTNKKNKEDNIETNTLKTGNIIYASPSVRKLARELDCDLNTIEGTGKNSRITIQDVQNHIKGNTIHSNKNRESNIDDIYELSSKWGLTEKIELNSIKLATGKRLHNAWIEIPHVTQFDECDITELDKLRKIILTKNNNPKIKVSFIPFFIKAIIKILKKHTIFNTSLSENKKNLIYKKYFNIGIAVNTDRGLVVPVIKNADKKSIKRISIELTKLIYKAKNKRLTLDDMSGGCITISSLGGISGKFFTPIINPPEVAILGISNIYIKPVLIKNKFKARKILPISLSYDHRVIDGVDAANFTKMFAELIKKPSLLRND